MYAHKLCVVPGGITPWNQLAEMSLTKEEEEVVLLSWSYVYKLSPARLSLRNRVIIFGVAQSKVIMTPHQKEAVEVFQEASYS